MGGNEESFVFGRMRRQGGRCNIEFSIGEGPVFQEGPAMPLADVAMPQLANEPHTYSKPPQPEQLVADVRSGLVPVAESRRYTLTPTETGSYIKSVQGRAKLKIPLPHGTSGNWSEQAI